MPPVEAACVTTQKSTHHLEYRCISCPQQQVEMVGHQRPCVTGRLGFNQNRLKPFEEIIPVEISPKNSPPLYSPANDMVQRTSSINASFAWHVALISFNPQTRNSYFHTRPPSIRTCFNRPAPYSHVNVPSNISGSGSVGCFTMRKLASVRGRTFMGRVPKVRRRTSCMWLSPITMIASLPAASRITL